MCVSYIFYIIHDILYMYINVFARVCVCALLCTVYEYLSCICFMYMTFFLFFFICKFLSY